MAFTGSKYESTKSLRTKEISALIRADIKSAVKAGELPAGKYSVRTGGTWSARTIDVTFDLGNDFCLFSRANLEWREEHPHESCADAPANIRERYSDECRKVESKIHEIVNQYNYDRSDLMTDYFDCRFYAHVNPAREWAAARLATETLIARSFVISRQMFDRVAS